MHFFALSLPHPKHVEIWALDAYTLLSFLGVASYAVVQIRWGQLLQNKNSPVLFLAPGIYGWLLIASVMTLLYLQSPFYMILVVLGVGTLMILNGQTADEQFGLTRMPFFKVALWSLLVCGAVIFVETPLSDGVEWIMNAIHVPHPEQQSVETFRGLSEPGPIFGFMFQAVLLSPLIEEIFFRGFLLTFLKRYMSALGAILLSAGVFAFAHANLDSAIPLWFLGIVLGVAYQHTGSLLLPIGIHACWNFCTAIALLMEKGGG